MRMYERGRKVPIQGKTHRREKDSFKRNKLPQKEMVLSVCFQMEMIHFTVKI